MVEKLVPKIRFSRFTDEWIKIPAGEIFKNVSNKNHDGTLPILAVTQDKGVVPRDSIDFDIKTSEKSVKTYKIIEPGDYVISLRSFQGGIEYSYIKGICSPAYTILKPKKDIFDDFYKFYLKKDEFISRLNYAVIGIRDGKQISYKDFSEIKIPYTSVPEQKRISEFLNVIDNKINLLTRKYENYQNFKKYLMQQIFTQKLRFDFDEEWNNDTIGNNSEVFGRIGFRGYTVDDLVNKGEGALTIGGKHISKDYQLDLSDPEYLSWEKYEESPEIKIYNNDVLLVKTASVGKVCFIENLNEPATLNPQLIVFKNIKLNNKFFYYYLTSNLFQKDIHKIKSTTGIPTITQKELLNLNIIYPSLEEQEKIVNLLSIVDKKIFAIDKNIQDIKEFKKGLLQQMFI